MSYCRWSSDNWKSAIYCYHHCDGYFMIHVAARQYVGETPIPEITEEMCDWSSEPMWGKYEETRKAQDVWLDSAKLVKIGLLYDGEDFIEETAAHAACRLEMLRIVGYNVPQEAIDALMMEASNATMHEVR